MPRKGSTKSKRVRESQDDYKEVPFRIQEFYAQYPDGRLTSELVRYQVEEVGEETYTSGNREKTRAILHGYVLMKGLAYRTPDDPVPGVGYSGLVMPGATPYTKGSEIENAETSAWGRAIAAIGIAVREGIATSQEIASKAGYDDEPEATRPRRQSGYGDERDDAPARRRTKPKSEPKDDDDEADERDERDERDRQRVLGPLKDRINEAHELGSPIVNRHSIRNHVKKADECGNHETLAELYKKGTYDELLETGMYVARKIKEARKEADEQEAA